MLYWRNEMKLDRRKLKTLILKELNQIEEVKGSDNDLKRAETAINKISDPAVKEAFNMLLIYITGVGGEA